MANCDCELAKKNTRSPLHDTLNWLRNIDSAAEIHVSYWCEETQRHVDPKEEASITWRKKIERGIFRYGDVTQGEDPAALYACWEHPSWSSSVGEWQCRSHKLEMPPEVQERYEQRPRMDKKKKFENMVTLRRTIGKDANASLSAPMSLADMMGAGKR